MGEIGFQANEFVESLSLTVSSADFCSHFVKTQLFDRFIEERRESPQDPEVRFFDESINAKVNRSRKNALINLVRTDMKDTSFLDDTTGVVSIRAFIYDDILLLFSPFTIIAGQRDVYLSPAIQLGTARRRSAIFVW
jgi:hypothetical protein